MGKRIHRIMEDPLYIVKANKKSWNCEERNRMIKRRHLLVILKSTFYKMYLPERCKLSFNFFCYKHFRPFLDSLHVVNPLSSELSNDIYISESLKKKYGEWEGGISTTSESETLPIGVISHTQREISHYI